MTARTRVPSSRPVACALVALATLALALAACGGDDGRAVDELPAGRDAKGGADGGPSTSAAPTPEQQAVAAYQASWDATFRSLNPPVEQPEIAQLMTGEALTERRVGIVRRASQGHRVEGSMATHPVVVSATGRQVVLDDCAVERSVEYDAAGQVVEPTDGEVFNYRVTVVNEGGQWRVSDFERREEPCTPP
jgi:hypothetical protein